MWAFGREPRGERVTDTAEAIVLSVFVFAVSIWIGGYVAIAVVARASTATLGAAERVTFFRSLGRSYFWVGAPALVVALVAGGVLARDLDWMHYSPPRS